MAIDYASSIIPHGHFLWKEYAYLHEFNQYAVPTDQEKQNAIFLFTQIEPIRRELGKETEIRSGCRTPRYTQYLRSLYYQGKMSSLAALNSAHNEWKAVDIFVGDMKVADLWHFCDQRWAGRMELLAYTPTWVHLDTRNWGKHERFKP